MRFPEWNLGGDGFSEKSIVIHEKGSITGVRFPNETQETRCESGLQPNAKEGVTI